jgi:DNA-binding protein HU-beta
MNKLGLIEELTKKVEGLSRRQAEKVLGVLVETIIAKLKKGEEVTIASFGTFSSMLRYARGGVNPRNPKERIKIPAVKVAKFKTGKRLKDELKSSN